MLTGNEEKLAQVSSDLSYLKSNYQVKKGKEEQNNRMKKNIMSHIKGRINNGRNMSKSVRKEPSHTNIVSNSEVNQKQWNGVVSEDKAQLIKLLEQKINSVDEVIITEVELKESRIKKEDLQAEDFISPVKKTKVHAPSKTPSTQARTNDFVTPQQKSVFRSMNNSQYSDMRKSYDTLPRPNQNSFLSQSQSHSTTKPNTAHWQAEKSACKKKVQGAQSRVGRLIQMKNSSLKQ